MATITPKPSYNIQALLDTGEQPWGELPGETFEAIRDGIDAHNGALLVPVILSARHRLIDGHHRLMAAQQLGRKQIKGTEVRIDQTAVDSETEALAAIAYQRNRRQTSMEDNAKVARQLMRRFGWSQGVVAEKMRVSAAAVSKWLSKFPDDDDDPMIRTGRDGKTYTVGDPEAGPPKRRRRVEIGPLEYMATKALEWGDPQLLAWVASWARDAKRADVVAVLADLKAIVDGAERIVEALDSPGGEW